MAFKTMQQLVTDVQTTLYQAAGPAVQVYSEDVVKQYVQDAFDHVFEIHWWPRFIVRYRVTLDPTTGQSVETPTFINDYRDVRYVYYNDDTVPLPKLPLDYNSFRFTAGPARFVEMADNAKLVRVWPNQAEGTITIVGRSHPPAFGPSSIVPFDALILRHFAAWSYFTDDGSSPASAAKHQGLFETRLKSLEDTEFNQPLSLNTESGRIPNSWTERPWS